MNRGSGVLDARRLLQVAGAHGWNRQDLSLCLGLPSAQMERLFCGDRLMSIHRWLDLCDAMGANPQDLERPGDVAYGLSLRWQASVLGRPTFEQYNPKRPIVGRGRKTAAPSRITLLSNRLLLACWGSYRTDPWTAEQLGMMVHGRRENYIRAVKPCGWSGIDVAFGRTSGVITYDRLWVGGRDRPYRITIVQPRQSGQRHVDARDIRPIQ